MGELMDGRRGLVPSNFVEQVPGKPVFSERTSSIHYVLVSFLFLVVHVIFRSQLNTSTNLPRRTTPR